MHTCFKKKYLPVLLLITIAWLAQAAEKPSPVATPAAPEILATLKKPHPRLLMSTEDFARLRKEVDTDPNLQKWFQRVRDNAGKILRETPVKYEIPDGLRLLATSRKVVDRVYCLALMYRLSGDAKYAERAWKELETAAAFQDWNPKHFLDTAEMSLGFAIGYDWLFDYWTPQQKTVLRTAIVEKGLKLGVDCQRGKAAKGVGSFWVRAHHNWNQVCNGGIGMGALAVADEVPALAGEFLEASLKSIQLAMMEYGPDGAWAEGPGYWNYATMYNVTFLAGLESALGTDYKLSSIPGFSEAGSFPITAVGPTGRSFNYADAHEGGITASCLLWLANKFNRPDYAVYEIQGTVGSPTDMIWYNSRLDLKTAKQAPLDKYFRGAEVVSLRGAWNDKNASWVAFKAGDNKANHSNLDLGVFVMEALGVRWAVDLGADNYNMPGYFGGQRWNYYRMRAEGHNTLVLNPGKEADQDPKSVAKVVRFETSPNLAFGITDLSPAYARQAASVLRGIALLNRKQVLIQDEVRMAKPGELWWFMHTAATIQLDNSGSKATLQRDGQRLVASILSPASARFTVMNAQPLPTSLNPEMQNKNAKIKKLAINLKAVADERLVVLLTPLREGESAAANPAVKPLANWTAK
ncbi:MAG: DUF4962 domain-containing protein [Verrucomicrobiota bacterium]